LANLASALSFTDPKRLRKRPSNEGHGFTRAVKGCALDGFSRWGTLLKAYGAKSSPFVTAFAAERRKDVPQGLKPSSSDRCVARVNPCPCVPSMGRILLDERSRPEPMTATVANRKA